MSEKHWIDDEHYRVVSDEGDKSWLYKADGGLWFPDSCIEVAEHHSDGTTDAYEYDGSFMSSQFYGGKEAKKNE